MRSFFKYMFAGMFGTLLALGLMSIVGILIIVAIFVKAGKNSETEINDKSVLHLTFDNEINDVSSAEPDFMSMSINTKKGLKDILDVIDAAKVDEKIKGIYLDLTTISAGIADVEELRNALIEFKKSGKFILAHSDYYTHKSYYLASVSNKLYMTNEGEVQFTGLSAQIMFYKDMLEKIGIEPEIIRHGKFKSAVEPFMLSEMSDANREQTLTYIGSIWNTMLDGISAERGIDKATLNLIADSLYINSAKKCVEYKLIDALKYEDEVIDELKTLVGIESKDKLHLVSVENYNNLENKIDQVKEDPSLKIAVIYATGQIMPGKGDETSIGSESLSKTIREARKDSSIKAIVLRIDSPGGSALASEVIWRETFLAQQTKPLIVSMGNVAASGGYYIACAADTIVAEPNTITGSIGVFGLMFNAKKLMTDIGVNVSTVNTNKYSDLMSPMRKMTDYERNIIQKGVEDIYQTFIGRVAAGRSMTTAAVDSIGQGRVWSGANAKEIGLVDVIGGLETAIRIASEKAGISNYELKYLPERGTFDQIFQDLMSQTKLSIVQEELGITYKYYERYKTVSKIDGIQAGMPYFIDIQ